MTISEPRDVYIRRPLGQSPFWQRVDGPEPTLVLWHDPESPSQSFHVKVDMGAGVTSVWLTRDGLETVRGAVNAMLAQVDA